MTGKVDEKGQTYRFEYDPFGRLYRVVDERGNIEKQYTYHYKGN
jgi:YD repeat-containing protein